MKKSSRVEKLAESKKTGRKRMLCWLSVWALLILFGIGGLSILFSSPPVSRVHQASPTPRLPQPDLKLPTKPDQQLSFLPQNEFLRLHNPTIICVSGMTFFHFTDAQWKLMLKAYPQDVSVSTDYIFRTTVAMSPPKPRVTHVNLKEPKK